jgi:hypothetical protein
MNTLYDAELALEQRLRILDETDIIAGNGFDQVLGG